MRREYPSNTKRAGVCMFYKDYRPALRRYDLRAFTKGNVTKIKLGKNQQISIPYLNYCRNIHVTLSNIDDTSPFCLILVGDFNARCRNWWAGDANSNAGKELDFLTSTAGYAQLTNKPTHSFSCGSSCIDLIFCNKPQIACECRIYHSLFQTCHHNLILAKTSANTTLSLSYNRGVWKAYQKQHFITCISQLYSKQDPKVAKGSSMDNKTN